MNSRNSINVFTVLMLLVLSAGLESKGQVVDNRISFYTEYAPGFFHGDETVDIDGFIHPSLFGNMNKLNCISIKALYKTGRHFDLGIKMLWQKSSDWEYPGSNIYEGAELALRSFSPVIRIHSAFTETGFFNKSILFLELAPSAGTAALTLQNPLFDLEIDGLVEDTPGYSKDLLFGGAVNLGLEYSLNQVAALFINYSFQYNRISSVLYSDNHFTASFIGFGAVLKLGKDKRFLY